MKKVIKIEPANAHQPKKRLRVAAYCRVSSSMADQLVSLDCKCHNKNVEKKAFKKCII